jgi:S1-C subfamily serine protease
MRTSRLTSKLQSQIISLLLGVVLTLGGLQVFSPEADAATETTTPRKTETIAQAPNFGPQSFVTAAVERTGSAVVRIDTEQIVTRRLDPIFDDPFFREFFGEQFREQMPQQRRIVGQGSGFIVDKSGIVLTNAHVVDKADKVTVTLKDGRTFQGEVKGTDEVTDLAVVKINPQGQNLPIAPLGDSSSVRVGDWAIAVGNPVGLNNTVTLGIISTLGRSSAQVGIPDKRVEFLQTDAAINPGNSGGPLLNAQGEVIGINTAIRAGVTGIGFAIPINKAKSLQTTLAAGQTVAHPYIGIQMVSITAEMARENNKDPNSALLIPEVDGVLVARVLQNTPAERAGIRRGDVVTKINGKPVTDAAEVQSIVENAGIDQNLQFSLVRGNQNLELTVRTGQMSS